MDRVKGLVVGVLALLGSACRPEDTPPIATEILRSDVDMAMTQMATYVTRDGIRRARVEADTAEFISENEIHMRPVRLVFYDEQGRETTVIRADFGVLYELTEDMRAEGNVVAQDGERGQRLETERLRYVNLDDRLYGDTTFTLFRDLGPTVIEGSGFESDVRMDSLTVLDSFGETDRSLLQGPSSAPVTREDSLMDASISNTLCCNETLVSLDVRVIVEEAIKGE